MIRLFTLLFIILCAGGFSDVAIGAPFKMVIVTDPEARAAADRTRQFILSQPPFNRLGSQLEIVILEVSAENMGCRTHPTMPRQISCNYGILAEFGASAGAHRTIGLTSRGSGGAGGSIPIASADAHISVVLHELFHSLGLGDEYKYDQPIERTSLCNPPQKYANLAMFPPDSSYSSEDAARSRHARDIPWFGWITDDVRITTLPGLGTTPGLFDAGKPALYPGGACANWTPTWKPYSGRTIMSDLQNEPVIPPWHQTIILKEMAALRGTAFDLVPETNCPSCANPGD